MSRPVFGQDRDPGVVAGLLAGSADFAPLRIKKPPLSKRPNPMVGAHGRGPEWATCGACVNLAVKFDNGGGKRFYGCELRGKFTSGPGTDHLVGWPACALFEERDG